MSKFKKSQREHFIQRLNLNRNNANRRVPTEIAIVQNIGALKWLQDFKSIKNRLKVALSVRTHSGSMETCNSKWGNGIFDENEMENTSFIHERIRSRGLRGDLISSSWMW